MYLIFLSVNRLLQHLLPPVDTAKCVQKALSIAVYMAKGLAIYWMVGSLNLSRFMLGMCYQ